MRSVKWLVKFGYLFLCVQSSVFADTRLPATENDNRGLKRALRRSWESTARYTGCREVVRHGLGYNSYGVEPKESFSSRYGKLTAIKVNGTKNIFSGASGVDTISWSATGRVETDSGNEFTYVGGGTNLGSTDPRFAVNLRTLTPANPRALFASATADRYTAASLGESIALANSANPIRAEDFFGHDDGMPVTAGDLQEWNQAALAQKERAGQIGQGMFRRYLRNAGMTDLEGLIGSTLVSISYDGGSVYGFRFTSEALNVGFVTAGFTGRIKIDVTVRHEDFEAGVAPVVTGNWPVRAVIVP